MVKIKERVDNSAGASWYLKVENVEGQARVSIHGPKDGEKAFVFVPVEDLKNAVNQVELASKGKCPECGLYPIY